MYMPSTWLYVSVFIYHHEILSQIATMLKENSNLRAALKTVEQVNMEVENEKVALQDQVRLGGMMHAREGVTLTCSCKM